MTQLFSVYSKVAATGTAGLVVTVLVGLLGLAHIAVPATVVAALVTLVGFIAGYLKTERHVVEILSAGKHAALPVIAALDKAAAEVGPAAAEGQG